MSPSHRNMSSGSQNLDHVDATLSKGNSEGNVINFVQWICMRNAELPSPERWNHPNSTKRTMFGETSNLRNWWRDARSTYVDRPVEEGDPVRMGAGAAMLTASTIMEAPDHFFADLVKNKINPPEDVPFGRTRRDLGKLAENIFTLHPIRAITDAVRLPLSSFPLDVGDIVTGMDHKRTFALQRETRHEVTHVLAA